MAIPKQDKPEPIDVDEETAAFLKEKERQYGDGELDLTEPMSADDYRAWLNRRRVEAEKSAAALSTKPGQKPGGGPKR